MHITLCSDNSMLRDVFASRVAHHDARVSCCESGMELLAAVQTMTADLVVLDLGTHGLGGLLLVSAVHELVPGLPILAVSATADADGRPLIQKGIPHVILGPDDDGELGAAITELIGRHAAVLGAGVR